MKRWKTGSGERPKGGLLIWAAAVWIAGCNPAPPADPPLATVDGAAITISDFDQTYATALLRTGRNDTREERYRHLNHLIDAYLLADAARDRGLDADSAYQAYIERERRRALGVRFYEKAFLESQPPPTEAEVREAFRRWKEQRIVRHLFFQDGAEAQASHERLEAGRDFLEEAQAVYGLASFDSLAGFLGPIRYFEMDDAFADAAFALTPGSYSAPVRSRYGWHIIRVEDVISNPLLTESAFAARREGLAGRLRLRQERIAGDQFIRDYMLAREVTVEPDALRALGDVLAALERSTEVRLRWEQVHEVVYEEQGPATLTPETRLLTYEQGGTTHAYTVADYLRWVEVLPFQEARHRTAASVGRALRNDVLAAAAEAEGLADDPEVQRLVARASRTRLAHLLRTQLRQEPPPAEADTLLREAFDYLGWRARQQVVASYWVATFASAEAANAFRDEVTADPSLAASARVQHVADDSLLGPSPWRSAVLRAPLGVPTVAGVADEAWVVVSVAERQTSPRTFEAAAGRLQAEVGPYLNEVLLLRQRRAEAAIAVDTTQFEAHFAAAAP